MIQLLLTIGTQKTRVSNDKIIEEPSMFYMVDVYNNTDTICFGENIICLSEVLTIANNNKLSLKETLENIVKSNKELHEYCVKNRVGYSNIPTQNVKQYSPSSKSDIRCHVDFVKKVLIKKKDWENLKIFKSQNEKFKGQYTK